VRASSSGRHARQKRRGGRGTGAVKATGSYEEPSPTEGIPDHTSQRPSRGEGHGGLGGSFPPRAPREGERHRGKKKERRQGCQRLDRERRRGKTTPTQGPKAERPPRSSKPKGSRPFRSAEAVSGVVKRPVPRSSRAEPKLCEAPTRRKPRKRTPGTREVRVHAVSFRVAEVDRTHRASCPPGGQKPRGGCESKQGASRKEARSSV
jgi:hypothetical protein